MCEVRKQSKGFTQTSHAEDGKILHGNNGGSYNFQAKKDRNMELCCDADFCGNWRAETAHVDKSTAKSRTGYIITDAGCPVTWVSEMQTEVALSTTEAESIAMRKGLRTAIPMTD